MLLRKNRTLRVLLWSYGLVAVAGSMLGPIYAVFVEGFGGDLLDAGYAIAAYGLSAAVVTYIIGKGSDRVNKKRFVALGFFIIAIGFFGFLLVDSIWMLLCVQIVIGLGEAIYVSSYDAIYSKHLDKGREGEEWGIYESFDYIQVVIGALIGGVIVSRFSFDVLFIVMGIFALLGSLHVFLTPKKLLS